MDFLRIKRLEYLTHGIMPDKLTNWDLVEQVTTGKYAAFDALMARCKRPVLNIAYRMIGDAGDYAPCAAHALKRIGKRRTPVEVPLS